MARLALRTRTKSFPIVGIGASAGGLETLRQLLEKLPANTGMGFVLVQHLAPTHSSQLTALLAQATRMAVVEVRNGMEVKPNHVHVIPPNKNMFITGGVLKLTPRVQGWGQNMPIDTFLKSLAVDSGRRAIAVILSGTATDGAEGVKAIRTEGGITFAQDEKSAKYAGMPHAAVATGCVDFVASPPVIAKELARISRHPYVNHIHAEKAVELEKEAGDELEPILRLLRGASGVDFTYYKPNTIRRRIQRRMAVHHLDKLEQYTKFLKNHPDEAGTLYEDLLIGVTGFFRDPGAFTALRKKVFPKIIDRRRGGESIRVWVPGCSTGEEVYSLAILLLEYLGDKTANVPIQIYATDISERSLEKARLGVYPESIAADVSPARLRRYFFKLQGSYQISKSVRELCVFARQNIAKDPPFSNLDLISCRNVLIYLSPLLQKRVMPVFHYALRADRFLLLGGAETTGGSESLFAPLDRKHRIYVKRMTATRPTVDFSLQQRAMGEPEPPYRPAADTRGADVQREADRLLLGRFAPASVLVNESMEILQFRGHTGLYLEPASGTASLDLLKMAREGLYMDLRATIHKARRQGVSIRRDGLRVRYNGGFNTVNIEVVPIRSAGSRARHFLVLFEEADQHAPPGIVVAEALPPKAEKLERTTVRLEQELTATKEYMQSVVEELEDANEELKAANEEIQSSNEELQSTNEELETAKEELQSTNEELTTVNEELQNRNNELGLLNNDLTNLLISVNVPILMLDADLRVRRMTPAAEQVLHLSPADIGRRMTELRLTNVPDLQRLVTDSIDSLEVKARDVQDHDGHWYSLHIRPYRTLDNKIEGAVIVLQDIDLAKRSLTTAEHATRYADAIAPTVGKPLLVLDTNLRVRSVNAAFYKMFQETRATTEGWFIYDLGNGQWNIPRLRILLEDILPKHSILEDFEVTHEFPKIGRRTMLLNARQLRFEQTGSSLILLAVEDITELLQLQRAVLDISEQEREQMGRNIHDGLGQHLTGIAFMAEALHVRLQKSSLKEAAADAVQIVKRLQKARDVTHDVAKGLFPVQLVREGLTRALDALVQSTEDTFKVRCQFICDGVVRIGDVDVVRQLYRIAQEAVNNAIRHGRGKRIRIYLDHKDGMVTLTIKDNGKGFSMSAVKPTAMGLHIMNYRARVIGGTLNVQSVRGKGTTVICAVPQNRRSGHEAITESRQGSRSKKRNSHR